MKNLESNLIVKLGGDCLWPKNPDPRDPHKRFKDIGGQFSNLPEAGISPIAVTSGAIKAGMSKLGIEKMPSKDFEMPELQRLACVGWLHILALWDKYITARVTGGLLLTRQELAESSSERQEALKTIRAMLDHGDIPIINENDAITHEEITFGDNDVLAATLTVNMQQSGMFGNILGLVLLSTSTGLCLDKDDPTTRLPVVHDIDSVQHLVDDKTSEISNGGMTSKLIAARMVTAVGINMWLADGSEPDAISRAMNGEIGTYFPSANT